MLSTGNAVPWTRCGRNSVVAISENGPRAVVFREPRLHRERYRCSYFFADCGCSFVEVTICVVFVLAMRFTYSTFAVCNDDCSLFLAANIMDYFARISYRFRYTERHLFHFVDITLINTSWRRILNVYRLLGFRSKMVDAVCKWYHIRAWQTWPVEHNHFVSPIFSFFYRKYNDR